VAVEVNDNVDDASVSLASVSREQWRAFWAVFLGWLVDAFDFNMLAFILWLGPETRGRVFVAEPS